MGFADAFNWIKDVLLYLVGEAPYPLKVAFWVFCFLMFAGLFSILYSFNTLCDFEDQAYQPNNMMSAIELNIKKIGVDTGYNVSCANCTQKPTFLEHVQSAWSIQDTMDFQVKYEPYYKASEAKKYLTALNESATRKDVDETELMGVRCKGGSARLFIGGIDLVNKELWITLLVGLWIAPLIIFIIKKRS